MQLNILTFNSVSARLETDRYEHLQDWYIHLSLLHNELYKKCLSSLIFLYLCLMISVWKCRTM